MRKTIGGTAYRLWMASAKQLSNLGERWGVDWLIYNPLVFVYYDRKARASAPGVFRSFERLFPTIQRLADVGAGSGAFAACALERGYDVVACEHSAFGRMMARARGVKARRFDLTDVPPAQLGSTMDLAYCFEVAEHVAPALGDRLVAFLAELASWVVFTAAQPGQGGTGHVNERPPAYWIGRFEERGMRYRHDLTTQLADAFRQEQLPAWWLAPNVMVFERIEQRANMAAEVNES